MKISNINSYVSYHNNNNKIKRTEVKPNKNFDSIKINKNAIDTYEQKTQLDVNQIKSRILSDINTDSDTDKIQKIKEQIQNKEYNVNTEELANILINI